MAKKIKATAVKSGDMLLLNGRKNLHVLRVVTSPKGKIKLTVQIFGREKVLEYLPNERLMVAV